MPEIAATSVNPIRSGKIMMTVFSLPMPALLHRCHRALFAMAGTGDGPAAGRGAGQRNAREPLLGKRVLLVEDEALLAMELQFAFEDAGAEVLGPALSRDAALALIESGAEIDLAVLDVDLAGRDVYPVARLLVESGVRFLFHTGHGSREHLVALFPDAPTCIKPASPERLIEQLAGL